MGSNSSGARERGGGRGAGSGTIWELEGGLATISCFAASELDDLVLNRPTELDAVTRLAKMLRSRMPQVGESVVPHTLVDPSTVVAVNRALTHSEPNLKERGATLDSFIAAAANIAGALEAVAKNADEYRRSKLADLKAMRDFCVVLSKSALSCQRPLDEPSAQTSMWM